MNDEKAQLSKKYCGAVAVSWYRSNYTIKAIECLLKHEVKTNIHYVIDTNSIDEAIERLKSNTFPQGINAIVFLLFKPVGQGDIKNIIKHDDNRLVEFFKCIEVKHDFKIGFDSCFVPGLLNYMSNVNQNSFDTCEGGRYSMYITPDMKALPCSFDQSKQYLFDIKDKDINDAWNSNEFERFRDTLRNSCPNCSKRKLCFGGCPLIKKVVLCNSIHSTD